MPTPSPAENGRKRRSDFEANRDVILRAADDAFAEDGADVSISAIAKRAGVAPATIYRHFSNRHALGAAVYELRLDAYTEVVERAQQIEDAGESFRQTIHGIVDLQARDKSFRDLIGTYEETLPNPQGDSKLSRFGQAMLSNFDRARDAGAIRSDVTNADIALLLVASEGIARLSTEHSIVPLQRVVNVILDGVMNTSTALDGSSLTDNELFKFT
ncbi:MAG: TetR/AcrR family transcriptional regulator [Solirubrobacterales bacterium]